MPAPTAPGSLLLRDALDLPDADGGRRLVVLGDDGVTYAGLVCLAAIARTCASTRGATRRATIRTAEGRYREAPGDGSRWFGGQVDDGGCSPAGATGGASPACGVPGVGGHPGCVTAGARAWAGMYSLRARSA